jgi:catechol 2,3-dioxygenase-like lactoylglutathione lyase family enzyme
MIQIQGIDHLVLRVTDLPRMIGFYRDVLGCTLEREQPELGLFQLRAGRSLLDLVSVEGALGLQGGAAPGAAGRNLDHFCFRVDPFDPEDLRAHLAALGVEAKGLASRYGAEGQGLSFFVQDPEGNHIELKGPAAPAPHLTEKG